MPWLIDTDIFIEAERGNAAFKPWLEGQTEVATADVVRGEYLLGVNAVPDPGLRQRGLQFYADRIAHIASFPSASADYDKAAALAGEARRLGRGKPGLIDGLLAALALRTGAKVATRNTTDFRAMGCPSENPLL
ncbi:MAG TPA: PIN domain-containing protein [Verrucomicrobiae bacterium]|nr:PIN domain-containing protein [Verrucomicrobiae bacterium]